MTEADRARQDSCKTMMLEAPLPSVIARMAVPSIVSFLITSIYNLADTYFVSSLGTEATAAVSVNASLDQIIMMAGSMLAVGASSYIARLLGARRDEEASRTLSSAFFLAMGFGAAAMGLALAVFAGPLIALFAEADPAMREIGALCIRLQCLALPVHSWVAVVNMLCAGLGQARGAVLLSTSRQGTCFLPIVYPMALLWGAAGVAAVQAVADILSMTLAVPIIRKVKRQILAAQRSAP